MKTVRIGSGAGYAGDRIEPAIDLIEKGNLDYIIFECLAERTISLAQKAKMEDPKKGYNALFEYRFDRILEALKEHHVKVITNMGAANPYHAALKCQEMAKDKGLKNLKIAYVEGDDVSSKLNDYQDYVTIETKKPLSAIDGEVLSANGYIGCSGIVEALKKVKVRNPLMLLDEIDKTGKDQRGDTASALLEVLDPEQNEHFTDHYLEVALNLSDVLFVATANDLSTIPRPLLDRMEIIEVSSYTENEKYHIANDYLVKKQMEANGLNDTQIHWKEDALRFLITDYTREAGVRNLERRIGQVSRKVTRDIYQKKHRKVTITKKVIKDYLGRPVYEWEKDTLRDHVGIVHGLAWTAVGGVTLKIEVNVMPGKGAVQVTGSLGNVMKESAQAAISYIRSQSRKYKIKQDFFEKHDIHIHIPEGAVPKDGPSAGITMTTAVLSAITGNKVCGNLAMTGEVTIRGDVLMIGGLKEKLLAAKRLGITKVLVPKSNEKDVKEFEEEVVEGLEIVYVKTMTQVIKEAFVH